MTSISKDSLLQKQITFIDYSKVDYYDLFYFEDTNTYIVFDKGLLTSIHEIFN